jgi:hypothetical protein
MIGKLIEPVTGLLDKFIEDKDQKAQLAHELATMADRHAQDLALAQIEVNKAEAASVLCLRADGVRLLAGFALSRFAYHFVLQPFFVFVLVTFNVTGLHPSDLPQFDMTSLMTVLMGMLGPWRSAHL